MGIQDDVRSGAVSVFDTSWDTRQGQKVPETSEIALSDEAVILDATYLYADLAGSSSLAQSATQKQTAKIIRGYLNSAVRLIRNYGGEIRSFDGDRVMAIFINQGGERDKNTKAVRTALALNWAVKDVLAPKVATKYPSLDWTISHGVGIDTGEAFLTRGGVRNNNDLISIGSAPNVAAKLSEFRRSDAQLYITDAVYNGMNEANKAGPKGEPMWIRLPDTVVGGKVVRMVGSSWQWSP